MNTQFFHSDSPRSSVEKVSLDGEENLAAIQDFLQELVFDADMCPSELPALALHQLLQPAMFRFSHNGTMGPCQKINISKNSLTNFPKTLAKTNNIKQISRFPHAGILIVGKRKIKNVNRELG